MATAVSAPDTTAHAAVRQRTWHRAPITPAPSSTSPEESTAADTAFDAFIAELFGQLPRADQRKWAHAYVQGLLITPDRKTVRRLAASVSDSGTAFQALHQFVNASPWYWKPVRSGLARWVSRHSGPRALAINTAVLPKRGDRSCGVHRRFVPQAGRTVNCQVGIGAFLAGGDAAVPVDWRLLLPGPWSAGPQARLRARVPDSAGGPADSAGALALDLVDGLDRAPHGPADMPVVADLAGFADTAGFVGGLVARRRRFAVTVPGDLPVLPDRAVPGVRPPGPLACPALPGAPAGAAVPVRRLLARQQARHPYQAAVATGTVRLPGSPGTFRLFGEWDSAASGGIRAWITDLVERPLHEPLALARLHAGTTDALERLEGDFGLRDFEGRSYPGWHHHMTLVSAAFAYGMLGAAARLGPQRASRKARAAG